MPTEITVRPARSEDRSRWRQLWRDYCAVFDAVVPDEVTEGVWQRILAPDGVIGCLLACRAATILSGLRTMSSTLIHGVSSRFVILRTCSYYPSPVATGRVAF
jgi:hypothetical protein